MCESPSMACPQASPAAVGLIRPVRGTALGTWTADNTLQGPRSEADSSQATRCAFPARGNLATSMKASCSLGSVLATAQGAQIFALFSRLLEELRHRLRYRRPAQEQAELPKGGQPGRLHDCLPPVRVCRTTSEASEEACPLSTRACTACRSVRCPAALRASRARRKSRARPGEALPERERRVAQRQVQPSGHKGAAR